MQQWLKVQFGFLSASDLLDLYICRKTAYSLFNVV